MPVPTIDPLTEEQKYFTQLSLSPYKRGTAGVEGENAFALVNTTTSLVVKLPLPTEMRDDSTVGYTSPNLETVGDIFKNQSGASDAAILRNAGNLLQAGLSMGASGFDRLARSPGLGRRLVGAAGGGVTGIAQGLLPAEQVSSALQQQYGVAPNPNPSVQFQGPVLRDFTLSWAFYPKSQAESDTIFNLIKKLKARALPSFNVSTSSAVLNYPHVCQINFWPWDEGGASHDNGWTDKSIIRMGKCFMSGVNVNYHPYGTPSFFEGPESQPVSIQLTITFKETQYLTSDAWDGSAVTERVQGPFNSSDAIGKLASTVGGAFGLVANGVFNVVTDFFEGLEPSEQEEADARSSIINEANTLATPGSAITYPPVYGREGPGNSGRPISTVYTLTLNTEGKYVVSATQTFQTAPGGTGNPTGDPVLLPPETFDTTDLVGTLLANKGVRAATGTPPS